MSDYKVEAQRLINARYYQISSAHRTVARLPEGLTGRQALAAASGDPEWAGQLGERAAGDYYLRCYGKDTLTLDAPTFIEFRRLGGSTYSPKPEHVELDEQLREAQRELAAMTQRCQALELQETTPSFSDQLREAYAKRDRFAYPITSAAKLAEQIKFLRENFPNDGAEGETVHAVADAAEKLVDSQQQQLRLDKVTEEQLQEIRGLFEEGTMPRAKMLVQAFCDVLLEAKREIARLRAKQPAVPDTFEDLVQACKNVGVDLTCGACAALFYTGSEHPSAPGAQAVEHTCTHAQSFISDSEARNVIAWARTDRPDLLEEVLEEENAKQHAGLSATLDVVERVCADTEKLLRQRAAEGHPLPKMYESSVRCTPDPLTAETVLNAEAVISRGTADVEDLVAWRVAELRVAGETAKIGAFKSLRSDLMFLCVVRGDGKIEQPERAEFWNVGRTRAQNDKWHRDGWACDLRYAATGESCLPWVYVFTHPEHETVRVYSEETVDRVVPWDRLRACIEKAPRPEKPSDGLVGRTSSLNEQRQRINFCDQLVDVACDRRCDKAWGINGRPQRQLSEDPDDYVFLSDNELGTAPFPSTTAESADMKPSATSHLGPLNKWCVRECERSVMVDAGEPIELPDFDHPKPNK